MIFPLTPIVTSAFCRKSTFLAISVKEKSLETWFHIYILKWPQKYLLDIFNVILGSWKYLLQLKTLSPFLWLFPTLKVAKNHSNITAVSGETKVHGIPVLFCGLLVLCSYSSSLGWHIVQKNNQRSFQKLDS